MQPQVPSQEFEPAVVEHLNRGTQEILDEMVVLPCDCIIEINDLRFYDGIAECHWCGATFDVFDIAAYTVDVVSAARGAGMHPHKLAQFGPFIFETTGPCGDHYHGRLYKSANQGIDLSASAPIVWMRN